MKQTQRRVGAEITAKKEEEKALRNKETLDWTDREAREAQENRKGRIQETCQVVEKETRAVLEGDMTGKKIVKEGIAEIVARKVEGRVKTRKAEQSHLEEVQRVTQAINQIR